MTFICGVQSPVGNLTLASDGNAVTGLWIDGQKYDRASLRGDIRIKELPVFDQTKRWLDIYFAGRRPDFLPPLMPAGTHFQKMVWDTLLDISYGETMTYGEIAAQIAEKTGRGHMSAQAVGQAVGHNPISILIPCHRVVGSGGNLTGYAAGIDKKIHLLSLEGVNMDRFYVRDIMQK